MDLEAKTLTSGPESQPPTLAGGRQRTPALYRLWWNQAHDPAGQRLVAEIAVQAEMVRIENFDQGRCFQAVGIHDAAAILVEFAMQQAVDSGDEFDDVLGED